MIQELQLRIEASVLADAALLLGVRSPADSVERALELVLQIGEALRGVVAGAQTTAQADAVLPATSLQSDALSDLIGYRERLLNFLPRETRMGLPLRTALDAGGADALLAEIACLKILLARSRSECADQNLQIQRLQDLQLRLEERGRALSERVASLERRNVSLRREIALRRGGDRP